MFRLSSLLLGSFLVLLSVPRSVCAADLKVRVQSLAPGAAVNLTAEGTLDWAHWGLGSTNDLNHKNGAAPTFANMTIVGLGPVVRLATNVNSFSWTDGTPALSATNVTSGLLMVGDANGFQITVPADTTTRRLKIYVGAFAAQGRFEAAVSDGSSLGYTNSSVAGVFELAGAVYTLNYSAGGDNQTLTVRFTALTTYDAGGYVSLQAATLATNVPPTVSITNPTNNAAFAASQNLTITANASDSDGSITTVEFYESGYNYIDEATTMPYSVVWSNLPPGTNVLTAIAYDNDGGETTSLPVTIFVSTNQPPSVAITNPVSDAAFIAPANITINTLATDIGGSVVKVEFFQGATKLGESTTSPFSFLWSGVGKGIYSLTARATDNGGATSVSAPVNIFVTTNGGFLSGSVAAVPQGSDVNLTAEGTNDWVHWGRFTELSLTRKAGVAAQISDFSTVSGNRSDVYSFADNYNGYTWSDGAPTLAATNTPTGVYIFGSGRGFKITAPADTGMKTLKLYVGTYAARGRLVAYLSDLTSPIYADLSLDNGGNGPGVVYTLNYAAASSNQTLVARFTTETTHASDGNVTLQAATLSCTNPPPLASLISPPANAVFANPANILIQADAADPGGSISKVELFQNGTLLATRSNSPYSFTWSNVTAGSYSLTAKATDNTGQTFLTPAMAVYVTNAGGFLVGSLATPPNPVDLTAAGKLDWTHWGYDQPSSGSPSARNFNRKRNVTQQISNYSTVGNGTAGRYTDNLCAYAWTDGIPTVGVAATTTGFYQTGLLNGFQITLPADTALRRLKIYVGVYRARGKLEVTLSDSSAAPFVDTSIGNYNSAVGVYTLHYAAASAGRTLTVKYTATAVYDELYGNVTLQAAALARTAPGLNLLGGPPVGPLAFSFPTETGFNYTVQFSDSLNPVNWQTLTNFAGDGLEAFISDPGPLTPQRFYRVLLSK